LTCPADTEPDRHIETIKAPLFAETINKANQTLNELKQWPQLTDTSWVILSGAWPSLTWSSCGHLTNGTFSARNVLFTNTDTASHFTGEKLLTLP